VTATIDAVTGVPYFKRGSVAVRLVTPAPVTLAAPEAPAEQAAPANGPTTAQEGAAS
jgi:hypothetical protein